MSCQKSKEVRARMERLYRQVCDRIFCPATPSLQYYIKTKGSVPLQPVKDAPGKYVGSDCKKWLDENKGRSSLTGARRVTPRLFFTYPNIQDVYKNWLVHQNDEPPEAGS